MLQIYDKLLELPLFLGIGATDLAEIVSTTKFGFLKLKPKEILVKENDKGGRLYFLMDGKLIVESHADNHSYSVIEEITAPTAIQPERLFGLVQFYSKTFVAATKCNILYIDKSEVLNLTNNYLIFRLNLLNMLSTQAQRCSRIPWQQHPKDIQEKFVYFVRTHCDHPAGKKTIKINMQTLANELHESRLNVSKMLNALNKNNTIALTRSEINIPSLEKIALNVLYSFAYT